MSKSVSAMILAAGKGTRMRSERAKVLHELAGEPLVGYSVRACQGVGAEPIALVVGHQAEAVEATMRARFGDTLAFALQAEQLGTGHAAQMGLAAAGEAELVLILAGDVPLLRSETLARLIEACRPEAALSLLTTILPDPTGYGRIIREGDSVARIVEHKDATEAERAVAEVNAGIYCVRRDFLKQALSDLSSDNAQGEYYLTDIVQKAVAAGKAAAPVVVEDPMEVSGANHRGQLAELGQALKRRTNAAWMIAGVTMDDPEQTYIGPDVELAADVHLGPGVHLRGKTKIAAGAHIDVGCVLTDAEVEAGVHVKPYSVFEEAVVRARAIIGPFSRLRPGAEIMEEAHVGNFVELKKSTLGKGAKANHLAYLGDSVIGAGSNVGAGTITCNYDGYGKYQTILGEQVFIGSNSTLVAPVTIATGAYVAAGSVITASVGEEDLAFGRARQINKEGRAAPLREEAKAKAAEAKAKKGK